MFQDANEELKRIEQALLEEAEDLPEEDPSAEEESLYEDPEEDWDDYEDIPTVYNASVYNSDKSDADLDDYAQQVLEGRRRGVPGLVLTALILSCCIVGVMLWILLRYWT